MLKVFAKMLLHLDVLAPNMHLNINGGWAIRTWAGVLITLCYVVFAAYCTMGQLQDFLDTTRPTIAQELQLNSNYPAIDLVKNKHVPVVFAYIGDSTILKYDEIKYYFTFKYRQYIYNMPEGAENFDLITNELPVVPCSDLIAKGSFDMKDYKNLGAYGNVIQSAGICVDPSGFNLTVIGSNYDPYEMFGSLELFPCSLEDSSLCKPKDEVNQVWIQILKSAIGMNLGNKTDPITYQTSADDFYVLNTDLSQQYLQQLIMNKIIDNHGFLMESSEGQPYSTYDMPFYTSAWRDGSWTTTSAEIESGDSTAYFIFGWASGMKYNIITRTYPGFLDCLGNIGGLNSLIGYACLAVYYWWHWYQEKLAVVHAVYGFKKAKKKRCCFPKVFFWKQQQDKVHPANHKKEGIVQATELTVRPSTSLKAQTSDLGTEAYVEDGSIYVSSKIIDEAFDSIKESLDLVTICREINTIRYLASVLIKDYQKGLIPLAAFSQKMQMNREREESAGLKRKSLLFKKIAQFASDLPLEHRKSDVSNDIRMLVKKAEEMECEEEYGDLLVRLSKQGSSAVEQPSALLSKRLDLNTSFRRSIDNPVVRGLEREMNSNFYNALANISSLIGINNLVPESPYLRPQNRNSWDQSAIVVEKVMNNSELINPISQLNPPLKSKQTPKKFTRRTKKIDTSKKD